MAAYMYSDVDHVYKYKLGGKVRRHKPSKVRYANRQVILELHKEHIQWALQADGQRNPALCAGSNCVQNSVDKFPHPVFPDWIDWWTSRVFVCHKMNKDGAPVECTEYKHEERIHGSPISDLFDDEQGLKVLLRWINRHGPITIVLYPIKKETHRARPTRPSGPRGKSKRVGAGRGVIRRILEGQRVG